MAGVSAATLGGLTTAVMVEKATTGENLVERHFALEALDGLHAGTIRDLRLLRALLPRVRWDLGRMAAEAGRHWAQATDVAGALVRDNGLPWRTAHQIVGILVRYCDERGLAPGDATTELLDEAAVEYMDEPVGLSAHALAAALDPRQVVEARSAAYGGPAPADVELQIAELTSTLERDQSVQSEAAAKLQAADEKLREGIAALLEATNSGLQSNV
jgi:argininosuccinate lyase